MHSDTSSSILNYKPQLDGLRAVAVASVMAFHFIPWVDRYAPLGSMGVRLFFVISGFSHHRHFAVVARPAAGGRAEDVLRPPGTPHLPAVLLRARGRRRPQHRAGSRHVCMARDLSVQYLFLLARRLAWLGLAPVVAGGGRAVLPGVAAADSVCPRALAAAGRHRHDPPGADLTAAAPSSDGFGAADELPGFVGDGGVDRDGGSPYGGPP